MAAVLRAEGLYRSFGQVTALGGADFDVERGEIVALIGDNGAGKSTLVKVLSGNLAPDAGAIEFEGRPVTLDSPATASRLGIEVVHQDLALAPHLDPAQNMFLGREIPARGLLGRLGFLDERTMRERTRAGLADLGGTVRTLDAPVGAMSGGQRQQIAIARAIAWAGKVVFLDEPTASLGVVQTRNVLDSIRRVRDRGLAVVFISHSMPEVLEIADRIEVLRLGRRVATYRAAETGVEQLVGAMTGALDLHGGQAGAAA
jgi:simple sugar transport system ATP-binding protein